MDIVDDAAGEQRQSLLPGERRRRDSLPPDAPGIAAEADT